MKKTKMLKKNYEFRKVLSKGKYYSGKNIEAYVLENNKKDCNFLGLAISVKTAKAVKRNMIKRLLRENYKILENNIINGVSIVFLWKKGIDTKNALFNNIKDDMNYIFDIFWDDLHIQAHFSYIFLNPTHNYEQSNLELNAEYIPKIYIYFHSNIAYSIF